jgi:hypothetical protein
MPAVFVATKPTVLIVTDGAPRFTPVPGTSLEYVANTTAKVFKEPTDQEFYVMTSGHWFRAWKMDGPWQSIQSDQLPADFARIPNTITSNPGGSK